MSALWCVTGSPRPRIEPLRDDAPYRYIRACRIMGNAAKFPKFKIGYPETSYGKSPVSLPEMLGRSHVDGLP